MLRIGQEEDTVLAVVSITVCERKMSLPDGRRHGGVDLEYVIGTLFCVFQEHTDVRSASCV